ncbi:MAG: dihydropteroate synthase [Sandaracinaceae bacterium]|nr:dihydropteroate synthase [Sandaracinaceae bacterium]
MVRGGTSLEHSNSASRGHQVAIWGVLNVTPDSFSDGGEFLSRDKAVEQGVRMLRSGAHVIDVGGESSRPKGTTYGDGAETISVEEEIRRTAPVIEILCREHHAVVSIDTVKADVARAAIRAGAKIVNDVSCGASAELLQVVAQAGVELVLMHTRDRGQIDETTTRYSDLVGDVVRELEVAVARACARGVPLHKIWIDPGLGFAKTWSQSLHLLAHIDAFVSTGRPVLVGPSRKSFIAEAVRHAVGETPQPTDRLGGTAAAITMSVLAGAHAVRVHDVAPMRQTVELTLAAMHARDLGGV